MEFASGRDSKLDALMTSPALLTFRAQVPADVLIRRYRRSRNAISVAFLTSRWKAGVPVPAGGGTLIVKSL
jgi:hypothetical protein